MLDWIKTRLALLAVGSVGLVMFAIAAGLAWELGKTRGERDAAREVVKTLTSWADQTCDVVGEAFRPKDVKKADEWGEACRNRIRTLAVFERDAKAASAQAALDAIEEQQRKMAADQARARKAEAARRAARRNMENTNARITDDEVGPEWFASLNQLGGLLRPSQGTPEAYGPGAADQGDAAGGSPGVP